MPPKKRIESTVFVIDCSKDVDDRLQIFYQIYSLKFFTQTKGLSKDIQTIILYNAPGLKPKILLNDWMCYGFEILKHIKHTLGTADTESVEKPLNFLNILKAAVEQLNKEEILPEYIKRIVFITDLSSHNPYDDKTDNKIDFLKDKLWSKKIWLYVIGLNTKLPKLYNQSEIDKLNKIYPVSELTPDQKLNYEMLSRFNRNVIFGDKTHGIDIFFSHKIEPKPPFSWYVKLNIGTDLEIPIMASRTTRVHEIIKFLPCPANPEQSVSNVKLWFDLNTHERVGSHNVVRGYRFQQKFVEITDEQYKNAKKIQTKKCLTIIGFADMDEVPYNMFIFSDTLTCIKADPRHTSAADRRFQLLVTSLKVKKVVALAYRVYNNGNGKKFYCIFPCPEHENDRHLLMGQFPYEHEFQEGFFKGNIEEGEYTSETYKLMKNFLDKLSPYDEENQQELYPLPPSVQVSRSRARMTEFLLYKAIGESVPDTPRITMHPLIENRAEKAADALLKEVLDDESD